MQVASSSEIEKFELFHASAKGSQGFRRSPPLASRFASARGRRRLDELGGRCLVELGGRCPRAEANRSNKKAHALVVTQGKRKRHNGVRRLIAVV